MMGGFREWLKANGYALPTQGVYCSVARKFERFCTLNELARDVHALEMYKLQVLADDQRNYTVMQSHATAIRAYLRFCGLDVEGYSRPPRLPSRWVERDGRLWLVIEINGG